jgi:protein-tyrosine phosphatase
MLDLHCHYLPGIDDGAQTLAESLALARAAVADGITHAVMTPHIHVGVYENRIAGINAAVESFRQALAANAIPLAISAGGEVRIGAELIELLAEDEIPFLGQLRGQRVLLLEMPHGQVPVGADRLTAWLLKQNVLPLIAHPERNKDVMRNLAKLDPFIQQGCLLQVTAGSLLGRFGEVAERRARELLDRGDIFAVATDAHNLESRPPQMREAYAFLAADAGELIAKELTEVNPLAILGVVDPQKAAR